MVFYKLAKVQAQEMITFHVVWWVENPAGSQKLVHSVLTWKLNSLDTKLSLSHSTEALTTELNSSQPNTRLKLPLESLTSSNTKLRLEPFKLPSTSQLSRKLVPVERSQALTSQLRSLNSLMRKVSSPTVLTNSELASWLWLLLLPVLLLHESPKR